MTNTPNDERELFEKYVTKRSPMFTLEHAELLERRSNDNYHLITINSMWHGWQACALLAAQPVTPVVVDYEERVAKALEPWLPQPEYFDNRNAEIMQENRLGAAKAAIAAMKNNA